VVSQEFQQLEQNHFAAREYQKISSRLEKEQHQYCLNCHKEFKQLKF